MFPDAATFDHSRLVCMSFCSSACADGAGEQLQRQPANNAAGHSFDLVICSLPRD